MKSFNEFVNEEKMYRWTVYKGSIAKNNDAPYGLEANFLEYLNNDELDNFMNSNVKKYPILVVVRSDGKWVVYDQPSGTKYKKGKSGNNFNKEWKGFYNKKADV